jgi:hypothetical protein
LLIGVSPSGLCRRSARLLKRFGSRDARLEVTGVSAGGDGGVNVPVAPAAMKIMDLGIARFDSQDVLTRFREIGRNGRIAVAGDRLRRI